MGFWNGAGRRGGSIIDLIMEVEGVDVAGAMTRAKWFLGLGGEDSQSKEDRDRIDERRRQAEQLAAQYEAESEMDLKRRTEYAQEIWKASEPISGTLAEKYLLSRGLKKMAWPDTLRFHPSLRHNGGTRHPSMICKVVDAAGFFAGVWRVFLTRDGTGKAPIDTPRLGLGSGGAVRLSGGGEWVSVAEGVETSLAALQMAPGGPAVYALLSTSGMSGWKWPIHVKQVTVYPDGDRPKERNGMIVPPPGMVAARALERRLAEAKIPTTVMDAPLFADFLDVFNKTKGVFDEKST